MTWNVATSAGSRAHLQLVELVYVRLAHLKTRPEAITSRPMLFSGIARLAQHAGQSRLLLTLTYAAGDHIKSMIFNIRKGLDHILANASHLTKADRWGVLARYIINKIIPTKPDSSICC